MGRAFEFRKERKFKRWGQMAKSFTKIGKDIAIAVKQAGPDPSTNAKLRIAMQNAKAVNMPKDNVLSAIKRATSKDESNYQEIVYEGYGPHGIAVMVECATDNPNRTVANIRVIFNKGGGALGTSGSVGFMFERKGVFTIPAQGIDIEELELELIDFGAEEIFSDGEEIVIYTAFTDFGQMQKAIEDKGITINSASLQRIAANTNELPADQEQAFFNFLEKLEDDDDVQAVFHSLKINDSEGEG